MKEAARGEATVEEIELVKSLGEYSGTNVQAAVASVLAELNQRRAASIDRRAIVEEAFADVEADLIRYGRYSLASEIRKVMDAVLAEYEEGK